MSISFLDQQSLSEKYICLKMNRFLTILSYYLDIVELIVEVSSSSSNKLKLLE